MYILVYNPEYIIMYILYINKCCYATYIMQTTIATGDVVDCGIRILVPVLL